VTGWSAPHLRRSARTTARPGGRLLEALEQRVGRLLGEPVRVFDDQDLPPPPDRCHRRPADQLADLVDAEGELVGTDQGDVGVGAGK
jgi:hypothetical protein